MIKPKGLFSELQSDAPAGLVVFLVALPLCLGIALASGAPLFAGLIAGVVGGIVVGSLSGSPLSVSGPAAGLFAIVLGAIESLKEFDIFLVAVVLAGVIQLVLGFAKAGIVGYYFPSAVIKGMLAGIGITLILTQFPHALGYDLAAMEDEAISLPNGKEVSNKFVAGLYVIWLAINEHQLGAVIIALSTMFILVVWDNPKLKQLKFFKVVPGALLAVILGVVLNQAFAVFRPGLTLADAHLIQLPVAKSPAEFASFFTFPNFKGLANIKVYEVAFTIAIIASIESLLSVEAADKMDPYKRNTPTNQELKAQGVGNIVSGLIGGLPITAVIVRSSANANSGAKTKMSTIIHGILLLVCAIFIPTILNLIPKAGLAGLLLLVGYKLANVSLFKEMYKLGMRQLVPFTITITVMLATNLLVGVGVGMVVAFFYILKDNYNTPYFFKTLQDGSFRLDLSEHVSFLNKGSIQLTLDGLADNSHIIIDGSKTVQIDYDVQEVLYNFWGNAGQRNIQVELVNVDFKGFTPNKGH
jgi:MFS superfamily sulfate permease-like transporter